MGLIVQKFGGSSVANAERVNNVARIVTDTYKAGNDVVVVVSAQGDTTDDLIEKAKEINPHAAAREMDQLLTAGEQISISLYGAARIKNIKPNRLQAELAKRNIVVVAGFQGLNRYDDLTTLGRGGSDTSAVAIAAALNADKCQIFTDVEGVYTADPRKVENAQKLKEITYDEMLELATLGAQVLNNRSVEMAKKYGVELEVLSSLNPIPGTIVKEVAKMEKMLIRAGMESHPGTASKMFEALYERDINIQMISTSEIKISVLVAEEDADKAVSAVHAKFIPND